jgi:hypothetical protein
MGISITDKYFGRKAYYIRKEPDLKVKYQYITTPIASALKNYYT